jgi:hypothetical protein
MELALPGLRGEPLLRFIFLFVLHRRPGADVVSLNAPGKHDPAIGDATLKRRFVVEAFAAIDFAGEVNDFAVTRPADFSG